MQKLEDRGQRGLPPPPAPTRRGVNPWRLSDTARRREPSPREEEAASRVLEELLVPTPPPAAGGPESITAPGQPVRPRSLARPRRRGGFLPLLALLLIAGVIFRLAMEVRESGDWRELIPALFILFFVVSSWWSSRKRRNESDKEHDGG
jgi:hypothetical protein